MDRLEKLLTKADQFKEIGKFKEALSTLSKADNLFPNEPDCIFVLRYNVRPDGKVPGIHKLFFNGTGTKTR